MELLEKLNTIATIKENKEVNGIEVYFDTKPEYNIISELKNNHFRWHNLKKCWYISKDKLDNTSVLKDTKKEMKHFRIVTDYDEFIEIFKYTHNNWVSSDNKFMNKYFKENLYLITDDNYILSFDTKFSISKDLWFDDEQPIPEKSEDLFIDYNMINVRYKFDDNDHLFLVKVNNKDNERYAYIDTSYRYYDCKEFVREFTEEETKELKEFTQSLKDNYIKRLKAYYKRYNKNIYCRGYWVNR